MARIDRSVVNPVYGLILAASLLGVVCCSSRAMGAEKKPRPKPPASSGISCAVEQQVSCDASGCKPNPEPLHMAVSLSEPGSILEVCFPSVCSEGKAIITTSDDGSTAVAKLIRKPDYPGTFGPTPVWLNLDRARRRFTLVWAATDAGAEIGSGTCTPASQ
jgi:hypothetical protein